MSRALLHDLEIFLQNLFGMGVSTTNYPASAASLFEVAISTTDIRTHTTNIMADVDALLTVGSAAATETRKIYDTLHASPGGILTNQVTQIVSLGDLQVMTTDIGTHVTAIRGSVASLLTVESAAATNIRNIATTTSDLLTLQSAAATNIRTLNTTASVIAAHLSNIYTDTQNIDAGIETINMVSFPNLEAVTQAVADNTSAIRGHTGDIIANLENTDDALLKLTNIAHALTVANGIITGDTTVVTAAASSHLRLFGFHVQHGSGCSNARWQIRDSTTAKIEILPGTGAPFGGGQWGHFSTKYVQFDTNINLELVSGVGALHYTLFYAQFLDTAY